MKITKPDGTVLDMRDCTPIGYKGTPDYRDPSYIKTELSSEGERKPAIVNIETEVYLPQEEGRLDWGYPALVCGQCGGRHFFLAGMDSLLIMCASCNTTTFQALAGL